MSASQCLTTWEKTLLFTHSVWIGTQAADTATALAETRRRFDAAEGEDGPKRAAFHYCYWSALLARDLDSSSAFALTNAREAERRSPPNQLATNLHNIREGILIGEQNRDASDTELADLCEQALRAGRLKASARKVGRAGGAETSGGVDRRRASRNACYTP